MTAINNVDPNRKRPRSNSAESSNSVVSSTKRAMSEASSPTPAVVTQPLANHTVSDKEIDEYMATQEECQGESLSLDKIVLETPAATTPDNQSSSLTPKEKLDKIERLKSRPLNKGETWYLVSRDWYDNWASACGGVQVKGATEDESQIGPVDNISVAGNPPGTLAASVKEDVLMVVPVPQEAWDLYISWKVPLILLSRHSI
ncbi:CSN-associated deubiquitinating enzyme Ubp12 [Tulasnella sp. 418]|nr:CSN-associated deubiquitinating enzyme Ubp12 [Tulasnella sp. 418]